MTRDEILRHFIDGADCPPGIIARHVDSLMQERDALAAEIAQMRATQLSDGQLRDALAHVVAAWDRCGICGEANDDAHDSRPHVFEARDFADLWREALAAPSRDPVSPQVSAQQLADAEQGRRYERNTDPRPDWPDEVASPPAEKDEPR